MTVRATDLAALIPGAIRPAAELLALCASAASDSFDDYLLAPEADAGRELVSRIDTKFSVPLTALDDIAATLQPQYRLLPSGGIRAARYVTIYFDTADRQVLLDHRRDRRPRSKLRIRHYVDRRLSMLEVKTRLSSGRTVKQRTTLPFGTTTLSAHDLDWLATGSGIRAPLQPVAWTACRRVTLLATQRVERVTLDLDVVVGTGEGTRSLPGSVIAELKQPQVDRSSPAWRALRGSGMQRRGLSKFLAAMTLADRVTDTPQIHSWRGFGELRGEWRDGARAGAP